MTSFKELLTLTKQFIHQEYGLEIKTPPQKVQALISPPAEPAKKDPIAEPTPLKETAKNPLEPLGPSILDPMADIKRAIKAVAPHLSLQENVPDDKSAKKIKEKWREEEYIPPIVILSFQETKKQYDFLTHLAAAISVRGQECRVILASKYERNASWAQFLKSQNLKLIITTEYALSSSLLVKHYKETIKSGSFLGDIPLFLLADPSLYLREPLLKASLWKALQNVL